jgi:hypothetical protein
LHGLCCNILTGHTQNLARSLDCIRPASGKTACMRNGAMKAG